MSAQNWRRLSLAALLALLALQLAWHLWLFTPTVLPPLLVIAVASAPLLLALLACAHELRFGLLLGGIISLFYFSHGVMETWADPATRALALTEAILAVIQIGALTAAAVVERRARRN